MADLSVIYKISADISGLQDGVNRAAKSAEGLENIAGKVGTALAGMFTVTAAISFGKAILADADALQKLSDKTGVSLQGLQRFQIAGDDAGNSIEQLTSAVSMMENRLATMTPAAVAAIGQLGLSFEDIRKMNPENQFIAISDAIRGVQDPTQQTQIAVALFGKSGAEVLATLKRGFDDVKGAAVGMSDETVRALDEVGDMFDRTWRSFKGAGATAIVDTIHLWEDFLTLDWSGTAREAEELADQLERMTTTVPAGPKAMAEALKVITADAPSVQRFLKESEKQIADQAKAAEKAADAIRKWHESITEATIAANLSIFTLNRFNQGVINIVPSLTAADIALDHLETTIKGLDPSMQEFNVNLNDVGRNAHSLGVVADEADKAHDALGDLAQAFAQLAQISGGSFGGVVKSVGEIVGAINVAQQAIKAMESTAVGSSARMVASFSSVVSVLGVMQIGIGALTDYLSRNNAAQDASFSNVAAALERLTAQYNDLRYSLPLDEVKSLVDRLMQLAGMDAMNLDPGNLQAIHDLIASITEELDRFTRLASEASSRFGPSSAELQEMADEAKAVFDFMLASGQYTAKQLEAAYFAMQAAMAAAGDEAAKAWIYSKAESGVKAAVDWIKELAAAGDEVAKAWLEAHKEIAAGTTVADKAMQSLLDQRKKLVDELAKEAPEEFSGSIQLQQEADLARINEQIAAMELQAAAAAAAAEAASKATGDAATDAGDTVTDELGGAIVDAASEFDEFGPKARTARSEIEDAFRTLSISIPVHFKVDGLPGGESTEPTGPSRSPSTRGSFTPWGMDGLTGTRSADLAPALIQAPSERSAAQMSGESTAVYFGDIHVHATGADLKDAEAFAPIFLDGVRRDVRGMRTALVTIAKAY